MIPMLKVITSDTSASSGMLDAELAMRLGECVAQDAPPLGVHAREAFPQPVVVPRQRGQLHPDLLVADVLADEVAHRGPPLLDERDILGVQRALPLDHPPGEALQRAHEQVLVRREVVVDEPVVHAGLLGEAARRDAGVPDVDEQLLGGVKQGLLGRGAGARDGHLVI